MDLVIDTNIIIAALLRRGTTRNLVFSSFLGLYAPEHITHEIAKYTQELMEKAGMDSDSFDAALSIVLSQISILPRSAFSHKLGEAAKICLQHPEDTPFVALAVHLNIPVWTHDKAFSRHKEIKTISTEELLRILISE
jgi:predicted nucleic acid-binding protein